MELYNIYFNIFTLPDFPNNSISIVLGILAVDQNLRESMVSCDLPCFILECLLCWWDVVIYVHQNQCGK